MPDPIRIFGSELSPYSVKVRAYARYKRIPHRWIVRNRDNMAEFQKFARLPLIPLVVTPEGEGIQDSTPILERFEALHPDPPIHPKDSALSFLSALIEEYGDEWANKPMFHFRWSREEDARSAAVRIARENLPGAPEPEIEQVAASIVQRMVPRLRFVGSSEETRETIEGSFRRLARLLEAHLADRPYLFGGRPAFADFGLAPELFQCASDPTPGAWLEAHAPTVVAWARRMLDPGAEGDFERWTSLEPTLTPILREEVNAMFLPWSDANARALEAGDAEFTVTLEGRPFRQETQKYHAKSLAALRARYARVAGRGDIDRVLDTTGCLPWLRTA